MNDVGRLDIQDGVGILTIDSPPVNALGVKAREALHEGFSQFATDTSVRAIVLICAGRTFFAGADISEFDKAPQGPGLHEVFDLIENSAKPVVAAIHGTALGGGLELALVCHYRIAVPSARVGLPEVNLGLLPGAGGTQRLPRIVGAAVALDLMTSGRAITAAEALEHGVIDGLALEGNLAASAVAFATKILDEHQPLTRVRDRDDKLTPARDRPEVFQEFRAKHARAFRGFKAPENIVKAVEAAVALPFDAGMRRESELFMELIGSRESAAQRHMFFAEREATKVPEISAQTPVIQIQHVGVVGAGTMGTGIAMNFLNAGIPVTILEMSEAALDRGVSLIRAGYEAGVKRGKLSTTQLQARMALLMPSLTYTALADVDLVIEAVYESLDVKIEVFKNLDKTVKPGAILASNTSFLNIDLIAAATGRPDHVIGLHFFSPANVMRLLEVVRGTATSKTVIATAMRLAKQIGKLPVLARVCPGFIANRLMAARGAQADRLILEGTSPADVDRAMYDFGFAVGPFEMMDIVGLDVLGRGSNERTVMSELVAKGRLGQKQGGGYYDYDANRAKQPSNITAAVIADAALAGGVKQRPPLAADEILAYLLYPVVNEGAKILEEGIAQRASDIDVAAVAGYNWPIYTGGPMFWASTIGLSKIVHGLKQFELRFGAAYKASPLLERLAAEGKSF